jgi:mannitol-specific phosphotransferase system IIBC component
VRGQVAGDVTAFGGSIVIEGHGQVAGDVTSMGGRGWFVPMLLAPFVIVELLVAFVIWLIQRVCQPSIPAAAA